MTKAAATDFQIFAKPCGPSCNLACSYCYYLKKKELYPDIKQFKMADILLEEYIVQHIEATADQEIRFSWHGGEPMLAGIDYFKRIVSLQQHNLPTGKTITNGLITNGTLLTHEWCRFLYETGFSVGISLDGPEDLHDRHRITPLGKPSYAQVIKGLQLLEQYSIRTDVLCVVSSDNSKQPLRLYNFFKDLAVAYLTFIPLVEPVPADPGKVSHRSVAAGEYGEFLTAIFDEWYTNDIGRIKVQIFEEAARVAFDLEHSLCIFRKTCGNIPVVEHNGDVYSCDHYVDQYHYLGNILGKPLAELLNLSDQKQFGNTKQTSLPSECLECEVLDFCNGGCPKNRLKKTKFGHSSLNYLCAGYRSFFNHCLPFVKEVARVWQK